MKTPTRMIMAAALAGVLALTVNARFSTDAQLAALERQLDYMQMRLDSRPAPTSAPTSAPIIVAGRSAADASVATRKDRPAAAATVAEPDRAGTASDGTTRPETPDLAPPPVSPALERGYIYPSDWEDMERDLAAMSDAQQKQHWERVFQAIESGELEVFDE